MFDFKGKRLHFIGVGGVGVNALARFAQDFGAKVSGSDAHFNGLCKILRESGADIWQGENEKAMTDSDAVIYSSAVKPSNRELAYAASHNIKTYERYEFLGEVSKLFGCVVAIAGTHGKTSTTAMLAHILKDEGKNFLAMIGGESVDLSNYVNNICDGVSLKDCIFLCEACEYKMSLLSLNPDIGVVTNAECDHPDCYENLKSVKRVFAKFLSQSKIKMTSIENRDLLCGFDERPLESIDMQEQGICDNRRDTCDSNQKSVVAHTDTFCVLEKNTNSIYEHTATFLFDNEIVKSMKLHQSECVLNDGGEYNYKNAAYAICVARTLGISENNGAKSLETYKGVKRRFERAKDIDGVPTYFDFAHHPTEIKSVLKRASAYGDLLVVFQPHTYSRTKAYLDDFVCALCDKIIKTLVIMPTYAARELPQQGADSDVLAKAIFDKNCKPSVYLANSANSTLDYVKNHADRHGAILFVGAGDIYDLRLLL